MPFNESHPIRATITIIWKSRCKGFKKDFENKLKSDCMQFYNKKERLEVLKLIGVDEELYDNYDLIGKFGNTSQFSYIISDKKTDDYRTQIDIFNSKDHIKEHVKFIRELLRKTLGENKKFKIYFGFLAYSWAEFFSLNNVIFSKITFKNAMSSNISLLFGWLISPLSILISTYLSSPNKDISYLISASVTNSNITNVLMSTFIIFGIFLLLSYLEWRKDKHVIRF